jgi:murein L,D-transpeptidase YcbB/YkuD
MAPRLARSLDRLRAQINAAYPARKKTSDGWIGDAAHRARPSDHNPNASGVVQALDITHDPANGVDAGVIAEKLRASGDPRIKYIISNHRIANSGQPWRRYSGSNPHTMHVHVSVKDAAKYYDDASDWPVHGVLAKPPANPAPTPAPVERPLLRRGSKGAAVRELQKLLLVTVDGDFGPRTQAAVKLFQKRHNLAADGIVGPYTWAALRP